MQLKPTPIEVIQDDPFKQDALERSSSAETLTALLASVSEPLVLSIDAPWGAGKTTFLRMWRQKLENDGFRTLSFNAWENDFSDDALVSLIGELGAGLEDLLGGEDLKSSAGEIFKKVRNVGSGLIKASIPVAIKIATAGALDLDKFTEQALASLTERIAREQIEKYESSKSSITSFKQHLSDLVGQVVTEDDDGGRKPLVLIIDELDRCRPSYAIEVLEKVKHFFSVDGIVFVLAIDKDQICHSIKSVYGVGMDVQGYLKRFIDLEYSLPPPAKGSFCKALFGRFSLDDYFRKRTSANLREDKDLFVSIFTELFHLFGLSLREQEQCFSQLSIALRTTPENNFIFPYLLGFLIVLKARNKDLYRKFLCEQVGPEEVLEYVKEHPGSEEFLNHYSGEALTAYLFTCGSDNKRHHDGLSRYESYIGSGEQSEEDRKRNQSVLAYIKRISFDRHEGILPYLSKRIDLVARFSS